MTNSQQDLRLYVMKRAVFWAMYALADFEHTVQSIVVHSIPTVSAVTALPSHTHSHTKVNYDTPGWKYGNTQNLQLKHVASEI